MTVWFQANGGEDAVSIDAQRDAARAALRRAGDSPRVLVLPPDGSRPHSGAGPIVEMLYEEVSARGTCEIMPALGTHRPMEPDELRRMFGERIPLDAFLEHRWRQDVVRLGTVPSDYVHRVSDGALREVFPEYDIPVEVNKRLVEGGYDLIVSVGQVVPHEVAGMANGFKNILVGTGGQETINKSHFLGAVYGMERMMGRAWTPVRAVLNYAHAHYLRELPIVYIITVVASDRSGRMAVRAIYVGDDNEPYLKAAALSRKLNVRLVDEAPQRVVAYLEPEEFRSTWLGNKAIYRTRMLVGDGGELIVVAPGIETFGEDPEIDRLIRRYGYRGTPATLDAVRLNQELRDNLSAAAHLIHGSSEGRFRITYATDPDKMTREEIEGVGFEWRDVNELMEQYDPEQLRDGPNDGFYYVSQPALGLWAVKAKFGA